MISLSLNAQDLKLKPICELSGGGVFWHRQFHRGKACNPCHGCKGSQNQGAIVHVCNSQGLHLLYIYMYINILYMYIYVCKYISICILHHAVVGNQWMFAVCGLQKLDCHSQVWSSSKWLFFYAESMEIIQWTVQVVTLEEISLTQQTLGGGFKYISFTPLLLGEMIQFDEYIFRWVETINENIFQDPLSHAFPKAGGSVCSWPLRWRAQQMSCCWMSLRITWMRRSRQGRSECIGMCG